MKVSIKKLEDNVKQAERNLIKAEERLEIARKALSDAIKAPPTKEFNVFKKWEAWSKKTHYEDVCNVEGFYRPPQSWQALRDFIREKKGWTFHQGGNWDWITELSPYIGKDAFINPPLPEETMIEALKCIMEHDVDYYWEDETWDM